MIGYVTLGSNDLERSAEFYDAVLAPIDAKREYSSDALIVWGAGNGAMLSIMKPFDGDKASVGNGVMVALKVASLDVITQMHSIALRNGGVDEGTPGPRGRSGDYGYFRDPDGNKICAYCPPVSNNLS